MQTTTQSPSEQLTVIASNRGPIWVALTPEYAEHAYLAARKLEGMSGALIYGWQQITRDKAIETLLDLASRGYWRGGSMFDRRALRVLCKAGLAET